MRKGKLYSIYIRPFKNHLIYTFALILIWFLNRIDRKTALDIGSFCGILVFYFSRNLRERALRNVKNSLGMNEEQTYNLCHASFINAGKNLVDGIRMATSTKEEVLSLVDVKGLENFDSVYKRGNGVIGLVGHIGLFEFMPAYLSYRGYKIGAVAREMYDPRLDAILTQNRKKTGVTIFKATNSPKAIIKFLHQGYAIGFLMDLESSVVSLKKAAFLNRKVKLPVGPVKIAMHSKLPLLPMAIYRKRDNRFLFYIGKPLKLIELVDRNAALDINFKKATKALEELIKLKPDEWVWMNSKWK